MFDVFKKMIMFVSIVKSITIGSDNVEVTNAVRASSNQSNQRRKKRGRLHQPAAL